jgi:DNA polymerase-3 subunit epsilon
MTTALDVAIAHMALDIAIAHITHTRARHRAVEDVLTLAAVLTRVHEVEGGLEKWLARALEPKHELIAIVSYDDRELAKRAGFKWDAERKVWSRKVGESRVEAFCAELPFRVQGRSLAA